MGSGRSPGPRGFPPAFGADTGPKSPRHGPPAERGWSSAQARLHYKALQYTRWARPLLFTCVRANARDAESECVFVRFIMCLALHDRFGRQIQIGPCCCRKHSDAGSVTLSAGANARQSGPTGQRAQGRLFLYRSCLCAALVCLLSLLDGLDLEARKNRGHQGVIRKPHQ